MTRISRVCKHCGTGFVANRKWQEFCSTKCKNLFHANQRREAMEMYHRTQGERHGKTAA